MPGAVRPEGFRSAPVIRATIGDPIQNPIGKLVFGQLRQGDAAAVGTEDHRLAALRAEGLVHADLVDNDKVSALPPELFVTIGDGLLDRGGLGGERDEHLPRGLDRPESAAMSGLVTSSRVGAAPSAFLILLVAKVAGRKSAGAAAMTTASAFLGRGEGRHPQLLGRLHPYQVDPGRVGQCDVGHHQRDPRAAGHGAAGDRVTLLAGGPVADEPDRVDRLAGASRGDHDVPPGQVVSGMAAAQQAGRDGEDLGGLGQPALAGVGAGEPPDGRLKDDGAALAQRGDVGAGGRGAPTSRCASRARRAPGTGR
jgi:hypothetical protein